ncbi:Uncharacterised protein [Mycoplasmopsis edwardii]|uniref:Uncharacterized protein n=1 Tax=Mycoplasmopsis edwardii TaxID=53558 RepID=A0A3B0PWE4_9BACT|nr:Uncharacterised protein [Mycoplasmopsis edwardii]
MLNLIKIIALLCCLPYVSKAKKLSSKGLFCPLINSPGNNHESILMNKINEPIANSKTNASL